MTFTNSLYLVYLSTGNCIEYGQKPQPKKQGAGVREGPQRLLQMGCRFCGSEVTSGNE